MSLLPSGVIAAKVCSDLEQPGGKLRGGPIANSAFVKARECFLGQVECVLLVAGVSVDEGNERLLPALHQFAEGKILAAAEPQHGLYVRVGFGGDMHSSLD